ALSATIGTGNIAGIAYAITMGGPGAVFWMWMVALLGSATALVESTLAQLYKRRAKGAYIGGPAYYMQYGLHRRWLGVLFSIIMVATFAMTNQIMQSYQICASIDDTFGVSMPVVAGVIALFTGVIISGGIHRIAKFAACVVPVMAVAYLLLVLYVIATNITLVPHVIKIIVTNAFGIDQAVGGAFGLAVSQGVKRGLFSNEAGEGSTPNAAATAETSHPIKQGLIQALGVFTDTIVVCSCTAMIILISGVYQGADADGILLTTRALETEIGPAARYFVSAAILLFAYSSVIGNYYYGETNIRFITKSRLVLLAFRLVTMAVVLLGGYMTLSEIWSLVDLCMACLVVINVTAILFLSPKVFTLLDDYLRQRKAGRDPVFRAETMPEVAADLDAWK
ncbi:MAG: alanine:cation symporter family protein, partial [Oscillospiraceae bacterium]|nr:alanine:cation symporter family protein [Oscillospiraceae bacterium]